MRILLRWVILAILITAAPGLAQERETLGVGRLFTNDQIGDGEDRWRTSNYVVSIVRAPGWEGRRPPVFGEILEYRLRAELIAPDNLAAPAPGDRRYAAALSLGAHTHFSRMGLEMSLGADLTLTGPHNGLGGLHREFHQAIGMQPPTHAVLASQLGDKLHAGLTFEAARRVPLSGGAVLRPFVELRAGPEDLVRAGADLHFGRLGRDDLALRDVTTGQLYRAVRDKGAGGMSFTLGADIARVYDSIYLTEADGFTLTDRRERVRAGLHWQLPHGSSVFYGLTWLGREFEAQPESQVVGSLQLNLRF